MALSFGRSNRWAALTRRLGRILPDFSNLCWSKLLGEGQVSQYWKHPLY